MPTAPPGEQARTTTRLRVSEVHYPLTALGPGRRLGLWVQGCTLACPGCMSRHTWDPRGGTELAVEQLVAVWEAALEDGAHGLTVSGGEPLEQPALLPVLTALRAVRDERRPEADLLLYTGFTEREARRRAPGVVLAVDALVTGRYVRQRPTSLIWRGSANQVLLPLSDLGRRRYAAFTDHVPDRPPLQISVTDEHELQVLGVPRRGDLERLDTEARRHGLVFASGSWHDPDDSDDSDPDERKRT